MKVMDLREQGDTWEGLKGGKRKRKWCDYILIAKRKIKGKNPLVWSEALQKLYRWIILEVVEQLIIKWEGSSNLDYLINW